MIYESYGTLLSLNFPSNASISRQDHGNEKGERPLVPKTLKEHRHKKYTGMFMFYPH
jgi:hypothetical protein